MKSKKKKTILDRENVVRGTYDAYCNTYTFCEKIRRQEVAQAHS